MQRNLKVLRAVLTAFSISTATLTARADDKCDRSLVTVSGTGEIRIAPDEVVLTVGITTLDKDISKSASDNEARVKRSLEIARAHGLAEKDIQSDHLSLSAEYEHYQDQERKFLGYEARQVLALTLRDIAKYQPLVKELLSGAIDQIQGIEWRTSKARELRADARRFAVEAARDKARALAHALGQDIGPAHSITEDSWGYNPRYAWASNTLVPADGDGLEDRLLVAPGELRITARVTVAFELLQPPARP